MNKQVLVVDDVEVCRYTIAVALQDLGIGYQGASTTEDALDYLKENKVDAIFLDWHLKKEQSTNTLDAIRAAAGNQAIICMMSAVEQSRGQELVKNNNVDAFLEKPIRPADISRFLEHHKVI